MKLTKSDLLAAVLVLSCIGGVVFMTTNCTYRAVSPEETLRHQHDSLETEWYKKQLESSYPLDHSRISDSLKN